MSKNMTEFENYYKARTYAIINLKASSNYVCSKWYETS